MKKSLIILALCVFSSSAFADTLFSCTTTNGKQIKLTDKGETLEYRFGKVSHPELVLNVAKNDARYYDWRGVGRSIIYSVDIKNGDTSYNVFHAFDRLEHKVSAGVTVSLPNGKYVEINCNTNKKIINNLEGIEGIPSGYDD